MTGKQMTAPRWIMGVSILLLLWNLIGVGFFFSQYAMTPDDIAKLPSTQQFLWTHMTTRVWIAYAVAVAAGTLGALSLMLRKGLALALSGLSLVAVIIQFTNPALLQVAKTEGFGIMGFPLCIIAIAAVQTALAWRWRAAGWLA